jgi:hypothetical protein
MQLNEWTEGGAAQAKGSQVSVEVTGRNFAFRETKRRLDDSHRKLTGRLLKNKLLPLVGPLKSLNWSALLRASVGSTSDRPTHRRGRDPGGARPESAPVRRRRQGGAARGRGRCRHCAGRRAAAAAEEEGGGARRWRRASARLRFRRRRGARFPAGADERGRRSQAPGSHMRDLRGANSLPRLGLRANRVSESGLP